LKVFSKVFFGRGAKLSIVYRSLSDEYYIGILMYERVLLIEKINAIVDKYADYFKITARYSSKAAVSNMRPP
jgi:hypothetical protein